MLPDSITDNKTGIEFYGVNTISRDALINFFNNFNEIDNIAQNDSRQEYERHTQLGIKSFQFEPAWVKITSNNVIVGYIGTI